jgi:hypothetical protein
MALSSALGFTRVTGDQVEHSHAVAMVANAPAIATAALDFKDRSISNPAYCASTAIGAIAIGLGLQSASFLL